MCKAVAFALVLIVMLGCSHASKYDAEANPSNFLPPQTGGRTWLFHASPSFDVSNPAKLREYVSDALKQLGLPPVNSDGELSGKWVESGSFVWSNFYWSDYSAGPLSVRTGAENDKPKLNRVIFVCVEMKK